MAGAGWGSRAAEAIRPEKYQAAPAKAARRTTRTPATHRHQWCLFVGAAAGGVQTGVSWDDVDGMIATPLTFFGDAPSGRAGSRHEPTAHHQNPAALQTGRSIATHLTAAAG